MDKIKILVLALYDQSTASTRVRSEQFFRQPEFNHIDFTYDYLLPSNGVVRLLGAALVSPSTFFSTILLVLDLLRRYLRRLRLLASASQYDFAFLQCELFPFFPSWLEEVVFRVPFVYDYDDALYLKYRFGRFAWLRPLLGSKFDRAMSRALIVSAGSQILADYAKQFNSRVVLVPSVVCTDHYRPEPHCYDSTFSGRPFTVGWIGSPSTSPYLHELVEPLQALARELPLRLIVVGGNAPPIRGVEVIQRAWSLESEVSLINQFDVGVMPLPDSAWARGKCAYKLIQCMACAIPVIASRVGANVDAVPSSCGMLASTSDEWLAALRQLAIDTDIRNRLGAAARSWVEEHYSLRSALPVLTSVILRAASASVSV